MQPLFETLMSSVSKALLGGVLSTAIVGVGIFLLVLLVLIPLLLLRTRAGSPGPFITVDMGPGPIAQSGAVPSMPSMPGQVQAAPAQPIGQPWDDRRQEWLYKLDSLERGLGRFYIVLLCLLMAGATGVMVFLYFKASTDSERQMVILYGGVLYALAMLWMTSQLFSVLRRLSPPPDLLSGMRSRINLSFQTSPQVNFLDDQALSRAQQHLSMGGSLDDACARAEPRYRSMDPMMQQIFRKAIEAALEQRGKRH